MHNFRLPLKPVRGYASCAPAKSGAGIGVPDKTIAHNRAKAVFLCAKHCHISIMVGRVGASKDAPVPMVTGYANPARLTTYEIGVSSGELSKLTIEDAANMATTPTPLYPSFSAISVKELRHA